MALCAACTVFAHGSDDLSKKKNVSPPKKEDNSSPKKEDNSPPKKGNFSLEGSQQPGSFISIGQNILDKGEYQLYLMADDYLAKDAYSIDLMPNYIYGITDKLSIQFNFPFTPRYKQYNLHSSGLEDFSIQFEYAYYSKETKEYTDQATILANATFPTGSMQKQPQTGVGSMSSLIGATFIRTYENWYAFVSPGAFLTTSRHDTKHGNKFLYQLGFGRNIYSCPSKWITAWLIEFDGTYTQRDVIKGIRAYNSGGNVLYMTPSFWYSNEHLIVQLGIGKAITQHLFGIQNRNTYLYIANIGWTFTPAKKPEPPKPSESSQKSSLS